jgi:type VI secretion system secreted protein VgrG
MAYTQENSPIEVTTPLGKDKLLLVGFTGSEAISQLFCFRLELLAKNQTEVAFERLLGDKITIRLRLPDGTDRYFNGICSRVSQGERDNTFTSYGMEVVPRLWLLTRKAQSRIFQQLSVDAILKKVLEGFDVTWEIQGKFHPRDYCVQYRETDFNFLSRLMEEEGIYYFFKHDASSHKMVVANKPSSHSDMPRMNRIIFEEMTGGKRDEDRIYGWEKAQELRSGKYTLWDHCFEIPHKHLEAQVNILDSVQVGKVTHKPKVGGNDKLEVYDYPGEYAQRFDGVDRGGGDRAADLKKIFEDNKRTVDIRMEQETVPGLIIQGSSNCRHFVSGHKFNLERHFNADGEYLLVGVSHVARQESDFRSGGGGDFEYENSFSCIPFAIPFRPPRLTPKPVVQGTQTAVVVGPAGEEIFTDKYGRVKVQFHWDREGQHNEKSSCWVRVSQNWAGKRWGAMFIPRIGQEVIVDFLEGDPDQPIITGRVYNADEMPPYELPKEQTKSTLKSNSSKGGGGFNEIRFEDAKGKEQIFIHAERDMDVRIGASQRTSIGGDRHSTVGGTSNEDVGKDFYLKAGMKMVIEAGIELTIKSLGGFIKIDSTGITIQGTMVRINSGGAPGIIPEPPVAADDAKPGAVDTVPKSGQ